MYSMLIWRCPLSSTSAWDMTVDCSETPEHCRCLRGISLDSSIHTLKTRNASRHLEISELEFLSTTGELRIAHLRHCHWATTITKQTRTFGQDAEQLEQERLEGRGRRSKVVVQLRNLVRTKKAWHRGFQKNSEIASTFPSYNSTTPLQLKLRAGNQPRSLQNHCKRLISVNPCQRSLNINSSELEPFCGLS